MIATLIPHDGFTPVPHIEISLSVMDVYDGGSPSSTGTDDLDGGTASSVGPVADGGPAALTVVTVPDGTDQVTVWRTVDGISYKVQGVVDVAYSETLGVLDHGAPPNASATYELECFQAGAPNGRVPLGSTYFTPDMEPDSVIIQQPFNPNLHAVVCNMAGSWPDITRNAPGEGVFAEGEDLPSFVGFGPLRGIQDLVVDFEVPDRETAARMWATLGTKERPQLPVWLIRAANPGLMPKVFYGRVVGLQEIDVTVGISYGEDGGGISRFRAALQQVKQPNPGLAVPSLTYEDLSAALGNYDAISVALPKYSDWATAWEYSGAAG